LPNKSSLPNSATFNTAGWSSIHPSFLSKADLIH
jgi:hypothetical protein